MEFKKKIYLSAFSLAFFILLINFVSAQTSNSSCTIIGDVLDGMYCNELGEWQAQKQDNSQCLNDFECVHLSCVDNVCKTRYGDITSRTGLFDRIAQLVGLACTPGADDCAADKKLIRTCGAKGVWENKDAYVDGRCGYTSGGGPGPGPGGSGCTPRWNCTVWSDVGDCGTRTCTDLRNCNRNRPLESKVCPGTPSSCGDGVCDANEDSTSCVADCPVDGATQDVCGDGVCGVSESSVLCSQDCGTPGKSHWWLYLLLILLILLLILVILFIIYKRRKKKKEMMEQDTGYKFPPEDQSSNKQVFEQTTQKLKPQQNTSDPFAQSLSNQGNVNQRMNQPSQRDKFDIRSKSADEFSLD